MSQYIKNVCIIDDDNIYINLVSKIIEIKRLSENIMIFKNGREALDFFINSIKNPKEFIVPQVIFLDLNMPIMDGWEFLDEYEKIRNKINKKIDLYVVSSSIDGRDIRRAKSIDVVLDYLTKPIGIKDLEKILV